MTANRRPHNNGFVLSMTSTPQTVKVSVLMPTYNYARFLPQAIESILDQSFGDFELIISDDASTDHSAEIISRYASRDRRIKSKIQPANLGMVQNWNWCLQQAQGRYIKYVFGDDFLSDRNTISRLVDLIEAKPGVRLAASARMIVDEAAVPVDVWSHLTPEGIIDGDDVICSCLCRDRNLIGEPTAVLFRKDDASRGFDTTFKQVVDLEFWIYLLRGGDLAYTAEPLCAFRRHPTQQTEVNRRAIDGAAEHFRLFQLYADYLVARPEHRRDVFSKLYRLRKRRHPKPFEIELMQFLANVLGRTYYLHWVRYKLVRPFSNLRRIWRKHVLGISPDDRYADLTTAARVPGPTGRRNSSRFGRNRRYE